MYLVMSYMDDKYSNMRIQDIVGQPTTGKLIFPDQIEHYRQFENGSIYWTSETGAPEIRGDIRAKWAELGWEQSSHVSSDR
jgi:uncharacterized protein with LGFP repeats